MMYVQSLTLENCFHIHLLNVESFSVFTGYLGLKVWTYEQDL